MALFRLMQGKPKSHNSCMSGCISDLSSHFCFRSFLTCTRQTSSLPPPNADITPCLYLSWGTRQRAIGTWNFLMSIYRVCCQWLKGQSSTCPTENNHLFLMAACKKYLPAIIITLAYSYITVAWRYSSGTWFWGYKGFLFSHSNEVWVVTCMDCW